MKVQWTSHLKTDDDKERFQRQIRSAKPVLDRLDTLLKERLKVADASETSVEKYFQPGWSAIQAHYNGEKASIKFIRNLLNLDQEDKL